MNVLLTMIFKVPDSSKLKKSFISKDGRWEVCVWDDDTPGYFIWFITCAVYHEGKPIYPLLASGCCGNTPEDALDEGKRRLTEIMLKALTEMNNSR